ALTGDIRFYVNSNNLAARINTFGVFNIPNETAGLLAVGQNPATTSSNQPLTVGYNQNGVTSAEISNTNPGTSSEAILYIASDVATASIIVGSAANSVSRWAQRVEYGDQSGSLGVNLTATKSTGTINFYVQGNNLAGSFSASSNLTLYAAETISSASTVTLLTLQCTAAGSSTPGPSLTLYRSGASSSGNVGGYLGWNFLDSSSVDVNVAYIGSTLVSNTNASVSSSIQCVVLNSGASIT